MFNPLCIVFQLYDVLRFDSTIVINVRINISSLKLNNQFFKFRSIVHEYASNLTTSELFCSCKRRKFLGQSKVKILSILVKKLVGPMFI